MQTSHSQGASILLVTTVPSTLNTFFVSQTIGLLQKGFSIIAVSSPGPSLAAYVDRTGVHSVALPMARSVSPWRDLIAVVRLYWTLRALQPEVIHTHTPKAGLVGMVAACLARTPVRIYTVNGLRWETLYGWRKSLLIAAERTSCACATDILCVSASVKSGLIARVPRALSKARVLGRGASHGVDTTRFSGAISDPTHRRVLRQSFDLPDKTIAIAFVGRIAKDKGIEDLAKAWLEIRSKLDNVTLFLCGDRDHSDPVDPEVLLQLQADSRVRIRAVQSTDIDKFYSAVDICVLPSYREGLPNVALEAGAMGLPLVATTVTGCVDAVLDGETGLLVPPSRPDLLARALLSLARDEPARQRMGRAARAFVSREFSEAQITKRLAEEYSRLMHRVNR